MTVPVPRTWVASEFVTATIMNSAVRDVLNFLLDPPHVYAYRSTALTHTSNGNWLAVNLDGELYDSTGTMHDAGTPSRLVAPEPGVYRGTIGVAFVTNVTGARGVRVRKNAAGSDASGTPIAETAIGALTAFGNRVVCPFQVELNSGDYIEPFYYQGSGGSLDYVTGASQTYMSMQWDANL
jgi:hypothetical protein